MPTPGLHYTTTLAAFSDGQGAYEARAGYEAQPEYDAQAVAMNTSGYNQGPYPVSAWPEESLATTYECEEVTDPSQKAQFGHTDQNTVYSMRRSYPDSR